MNINNNPENAGQGLSYWENEVEYFQTSIDALKQCHAVMSSLQDFAKQKVEELTPEREEVAP